MSGRIGDKKDLRKLYSKIKALPSSARTHLNQNHVNEAFHNNLNRLRDSSRSNGNGNGNGNTLSQTIRDGGPLHADDLLI